MTELLAALAAAARDAGCDAELHGPPFPPSPPDTAYVVIPHEYHVCEPPDAWPSWQQRQRTIALCVENPYTQWFELTARLAPQFPVVLAINRSSVGVLHSRGVEAEHLQLGYTPRWDAWRAEPGPRPIDVTYLGAEDARRDALLAGYGRWWWHRVTTMFVPPVAPKPSSRPDYLVDGAKYAHLRRAQVLVNLHRAGSSSFEWVRVLQAIANGCVVVSEPSNDHEPLVPGEHFAAAAPDAIPHVVEALLGEPERLAAIRESAYGLVKTDLNMAASVERLLETAGRLLQRSHHRSLPGASPPPPSSPEDRLSAPGPASDAARLRATVRNLGTEALELRRAVQRLAELTAGNDPDGEPELVALTPSFRDARPRVSVAVTLHNYEHEVRDALASVDRSEFEDYEVLVLDDASTEGSLAAVRDFLQLRPWMPAALLQHRVNRGLGASRNALARQSRGEFMFVLDADNAIYPSALGRLVDALDRDPGATFAYPILAVFRAGAPAGLLSRYPWDPDGFAGGNYVDAMAMIRLDDFTALGGYTEDIRMTGWEDFHFWCSCVETGRRGRLVPEILASYRQAEHSMLGWTQTDTTAAWSLMHSRFPTIIPSAPSG